MATTTARLPKGLYVLLAGILLVGVVTFAVAATGPTRLRAWQILLVNFLFWSGMAQGGLVFAAAYDLSGAAWGEAIRRLAQGMGAFLPISFLLFLLLFAGSETLFPWVLEPLPWKMTPLHPQPGKTVWLNLPFLLSRDVLGLFALDCFSLAYLYYAFRPEVGAAFEARAVLPRLFTLFTKGWRGLPAERERSRQLLGILAPLMVIFYVLVFSLLGFDLVMSLDPRFYSTLFGAYICMGAFYMGLAALAIIAAFSRKPLGLTQAIGRQQLHDLGKLLFGFCLVTGAFFWAQYAVIWYGNLPEETEYVILRTIEMPWAPLAWAVLVLSFLGPALILLSRQIKENAVTLAAVASMVLVGMWLERYFLVIPSLWHRPDLPLGWIELLITLGFLAAFLLTYLAFVTSFLIPTGSAGTPESVQSTLPLSHIHHSSTIAPEQQCRQQA